ncbi:MAG: hypothetical protein ABIA63_15200 [bacterium]
MKKNIKILGIDLNPRALKIVEMQPLLAKPRVVSWAAHYFTSDHYDDSHASVLRHIINKEKMTAREAIVAISGGEVNYQLIDLPHMPEKEVPLAVRYKIESII